MIDPDSKEFLRPAESDIWEGEPNPSLPSIADISEFRPGPLDDPAGLIQGSEDAVRVALSSEEQATQARELFANGTGHLGRARYLESEIDLRLALDLSRSAGQTALMVDILRALLKCALLTRDSDTALQRGMQGLQLARESGDSGREALMLNDLGLIFGNLGELEGALEHLLAGLKILRSQGSDRVASLLNNIGNIYLELGDNREALSFYRSALESFRGKGETRGEAIALGNIGRAQSLLGTHGDACEAYKQSLRLYEQLEDGSYRVPALARLASCYAALGRHDEARSVFAESLSEVDESGFKEFEDEILIAAGKFHLSVKETGRAVQLFERALQILPTGETTRRVFDTRLGLSEAYEAQNDHQRALEHFREYHRCRDVAASAVLTVRIRRLMLQFDVGRARQQEEIFRLRNVELAQANEKLQELKSSLEAKNRELHQITIEDALTGLHNRRYLDLQLGVEISRAHRYPRPLCAAMCDIDRFKNVNDRFSHTVGDKVLRLMAGIMREAARTTDLVVRYGGEEFLLILPDTDRQGAAVVTERIRNRVATYPWSEVAEGLSLTLSIGVSELGSDDEGTALLAAADANLYEAKRAGRDRVVS